MLNTENLQKMISIANAILSSNTSDEVDSIMKQVEPTNEQIDFFINAVRFTNGNAELTQSSDYPIYSVGDVVDCPYYYMQYDPWTGNTYKKIEVVKGIVTAVSKDKYNTQRFFNEYLYTVRYENNTSRGNIYEHVLKRHVDQPENI